MNGVFVAGDMYKYEGKCDRVSAIRAGAIVIDSGHLLR